ncbi:hypothetical protein FDO65_09995 [Nakamurella flava]|uniref:Uncharacterized protein n=1 Tax=Nakamurella flava TaxID=2576308 RepID=A0A4U6QNS0_9ACTN|nr:hypothetical protein [Nakamurella flava]TKV61848.1 hypothetical protein FDO65_09995 [Nakamurella flava]
MKHPLEPFEAALITMWARTHHELAWSLRAGSPHLPELHGGSICREFTDVLVPADDEEGPWWEATKKGLTACSRYAYSGKTGMRCSAAHRYEVRPPRIREWLASWPSESAAQFRDLHARYMAVYAPPGELEFDPRRTIAQVQADNRARQARLEDGGYAELRALTWRMDAMVDERVAAASAGAELSLFEVPA